ncbi:hypothetical protein G4B84_007931 [Aspergillus flavus NRRL3357]|nr:uncharacterized protein G4B84_007931 [Aspergillus flavus NRRL3357]QMW32500.1 hypothetical protein G4B84_007931 [Aspergillus flavus NRRL3357]
MPTDQGEIKYIAVLGATGNQGGGVVRALLAKTEPSFHVRAITRDVSSPAAQRLQAKYKDSGRLEFVAADVYNKQSLIEAFQNVYGVFAVTNNRIAGKKIEKEQDMDHELVAGRNIIDAAKRARDELLAVTALHPGLFYTNMQWSQYCQRQDDGTVRFCAPIDGNKLADWVDPSYDIGVYAAEIFSLGPEKTAAKTYPVVGPKLSFADFARVFREITSQEATFDPITLDQWGATVAATVGKGYEEDIKQMVEWIAVAPDDKICYGTRDQTEDTSYEDLGVKASTLADWMRRTAWQGPQ